VIRRRRRQRIPEEHVNHDRWLVSYADFITLLFAFFVVLYATAQVDNRKVAQFAASIKGAFQHLGVFTGRELDKNDLVKEIVVVQGDGGGGNAQLPNVGESITSVTVPCTTTPANGATANGAQGSALDTAALEKHLKKALGDEIRKNRVQMRVGPDGLVVSIREIGFFDSGDAMLLPEAKPTLARLAKVLEEKNFQIRVEGHTDNIPMHNAKFKSNWELSTARATEVVSMLVREYGFNPQDLSVAGYAEFHPVFSNDTEEGRRANRRIDLVVIGMRNAPRALTPQDSPTKP